MRTRYSPDFLRTLTTIGLTTAQWQSLIQCTTAWQRAGHLSRKQRQLVRKVQRVHTGTRLYLFGRLQAKEALGGEGERMVVHLGA